MWRHISGSTVTQVLAWQHKPSPKGQWVHCGKYMFSIMRNLASVLIWRRKFRWQGCDNYLSYWEKLTSQRIDHTNVPFWPVKAYFSHDITHIYNTHIFVFYGTNLSFSTFHRSNSGGIWPNIKPAMATLIGYNRWDKSMIALTPISHTEGN